MSELALVIVLAVVFVPIYILFDRIGDLEADIRILMRNAKDGDDNG